MGLIAVVAIAGFILVGVVTTLAVATASRRRELTLLRLVGATGDQVMQALRLETVDHPRRRHRWPARRSRV